MARLRVARNPSLSGPLQKAANSRACFEREANGTFEDRTRVHLFGGGRWAASAAWATSPESALPGIPSAPPRTAPRVPEKGLSGAGICEPQGLAAFPSVLHVVELLSPQSFSRPLSPALGASLPPATLVRTFVSFPVPNGSWGGEVELHTQHRPGGHGMLLRKGSRMGRAWVPDQKRNEHCRDTGHTVETPKTLG